MNTSFTMSTLMPACDMVSLLQQLIRIHTSQPDGNEGDLADYIQKLLSPLGGQVKLFDHGDNRNSLMVILPGISNETCQGLIFQLDTYNPVDASRWEYPPFRGVLENGYVYGCGASNMKGALVAGLAAILAVGQQPHESTLVCCFLADGERQGTGAQTVIKTESLKKCQELLFFAPTNNEIAIAQKGALWLQLSITGRTCHTTFAASGIDALEWLQFFGTRLERHVLSETSHKLLGKPSCHMTRVQATGPDINFIANQAIGILDARLLPNQSPMDIRRFLLDLIETTMRNVPGLAVTCGTLVERRSIAMPPDSDMVLRLSHALTNVAGHAKLRGYHSFSDASVIVPALECPFAILGPGEDLAASSPYERVSVDAMMVAAQTYSAFLSMSRFSNPWSSHEN